MRNQLHHRNKLDVKVEEKKIYKNGENEIIILTANEISMQKEAEARNITFHLGDTVKAILQGNEYTSQRDLVVFVLILF